MENLRSVVVIVLLVVQPFLLHGQRKSSTDEPSPGGAFTAETFSGLKFRSIGPALTSGRVGDFAVNPANRSEYYVAVASGGVWKTVNAGTTWESVFDDQGSYSIGCIALDSRNTAVVWVGTGENNSQRSVAYGDGVYKSEDGGKSWRNMGLRKSEHVGKILIDPRNSQVVYVACQGPLWGSGGDRGLYKTTDGGNTWKSVLAISPKTGVTDVAMDPRDPDILYAASYQRRRHVWTLINGGPESAVYKSVDGGATWSKLKNGLPAVDLGRIGLAISPARPDIIYATVEAANRKGGFFRSTNRGATWEKRSDYVSSSPQYYSEIVADPRNPDRVYSMDVFLMVTDNGGTTFRRLGEKSKHVDNHAMWIDPAFPEYYLVGSDGGIYESFDRGATWTYKSNLPVTQFYRVTVDTRTPFYHVYGGTQDNFTLGGPSRTTSASGITNADWIVTVGGDGFETQVDPENPDIVYSQSQYGGLVRFDRKSGENLGIRPVEGKGEPPLRWNWDSPLLISPHKNTRLYFAANVLYRSEDGGNSWTPVSGDLTRMIDRNTLPVMDTVWGVDAVAKNASTSLYGNATALSESPLKEGLIYVGTDDGLIQITEDGGARWRRIEKYPGVPETTYVSSVEASLHDTNTVYAAFDNHKNNDFRSYLLKSTDVGRTWRSIRGNLPDSGMVYAVAQDHVNPDLMFVGTEFGVFCTISGGNTWIQLKGGLPTIAIRDIALQRRENDLVLATFGRGFYILDDYTPLRRLTPAMLTGESYLFPVKDALMFIESRPYGLKGKAFQGENIFTADNPPYGAAFTYYLKDGLKTKREQRQEAEKEARKKGKTLPYPTYDQLRTEDEEEDPAILLTIRDAGGSVMRQISGEASKGMHRVTWDLRYPPTTPIDLSASGEDDPFSEGEIGPLSVPGTYSVILSKRVGGVLTDLAGPVAFSILPLGQSAVPAPDRSELLAFQRDIGELQRAVMGASRVLDEVRNRLALIRKALRDTPGAPEELHRNARVLTETHAELVRQLRGDRTLRSRNENTPPSIIDRVDGIVYDQVMSFSAPTQTHRDSYRAAGEEFGPLLARIRTLVEKDLEGLETSMERLRAPWTPGRVPDWNPW